MGMWIVVLRSASTAKKNELWFIVNSVPIRYSLREVGHISGLYCHEYPTNHERLDGTSFMNKYFERKMVTYADVEKQMLAMKGKPAQDRQKMAVMYFLASILVRPERVEREQHLWTVFSWLLLMTSMRA